MYKISPSIVELFRLYRDEEYSEMYNITTEEMINRVKGVAVIKKAPTIGKLIHQYLENEEIEYVDEEGTLWKLYPQEIEQLKPLLIEEGLNEIAVQARHGDYFISGRIDRVIGNRGVEFKTGSRYQGYDYYAESPQWKLYCLAGEFRQFSYVHIAYNKKRPWTFRFNTSNYFFTPEIKHHLMTELDDYVKWCLLNGLEEYITV